MIRPCSRPCGSPTDRGWVRPILVGPERAIRSIAASKGISLEGFAIVHAEGDAIAAAAVAEVRAGETPGTDEGADRHSGPDGGGARSPTGLRTGRVVCQVVLMEIPRDDRRFLLADTGICVTPNLQSRIDILRACGGGRPCAGGVEAEGRADGGDRDRASSTCPRPSRPPS